MNVFWFINVRSGYVEIGGGYLLSSNYFGSLWSFLAALFTNISNASAYSFATSPSDIRPVNGPSGRYAGFPVRCLASGA